MLDSTERARVDCSHICTVQPPLGVSEARMRSMLLRMSRGIRELQLFDGKFIYIGGSFRTYLLQA